MVPITAWHFPGSVWKLWRKLLKLTLPGWWGQEFIERIDRTILKQLNFTIQVIVHCPWQEGSLWERPDSLLGWNDSERQVKVHWFILMGLVFQWKLGMLVSMCFCQQN
jgi:hypothetical protein